MFFLLKNWSSNISVFFVTSFVFLNITQCFLCSSLPLSKLSQWHLNHCTWMVHFIILASQISSPTIKEVIYFTFLSGIQKVREEDPCFEFRSFHARFWDLPILQGCLFYHVFCFWDNGFLCDFELVIILIQAPVFWVYTETGKIPLCFLTPYVKTSLEGERGPPVQFSTLAYTPARLLFILPPFPGASVAQLLTPCRIEGHS